MQLKLGDIKINLVQKNIKNVHLSVHPPNGTVRISAPLKMDLETIKIFAISKLGWIKKQQGKLQEQERETPRDFISRESHYFLGKRYLLQVTEGNSVPKIILKPNTIEMFIKPTTNRQKREIVLDKWYREQLKELIPPYISKWEKTLGVEVKEFAIKKMRTRWGTCNPIAKRIWLNLELAKKPIECIEYIVVHEMVHLLERSHNEKFIAYMNHYMPHWRSLKRELNRLPITNSEWKY